MLVNSCCRILRGAQQNRGSSPFVFFADSARFEGHPSACDAFTTHASHLRLGRTTNRRLGPSIRSELLVPSSTQAISTPMEAPNQPLETLEPQDDSELFAGAMPKEEIGALRFLKEHPEYDGRGVIIAILDTGVDPGAAGLQMTSNGKPKVLDVIDCTGSGDVDMAAAAKAGEDGCIEGASGRKLRVNPEWSNPTGDWRVGSKHVYQLFSRGLVYRIKEERRKQWDELHRSAVAQAVADLARAEIKDNAGKGGDASKLKAELEARLTYLKDAAKAYEDFGPLVDCVVWHDGACWRAALDTTELHTSATGSGKAGSNGGSGALAEFIPMTDFKAERKYATFSFLDSCNFALNIYGDGATLSIVVDAGAHGTHVAGITAAHFEDDAAMNGIAPGAQIISCKIGDTRLGSMETGTGLTRALIAVLEHKCDLVNMSYGEPTSTPNGGRIIELANELVHKHGVIFVASAGNAGPALSTVGAPGGTSSGLYGIGAYVSPSLAEAGHSVRESSGAGRQYTWSSRGPTADGHVGVAFSAPGGAIAPVPTWTLQKRQLMNGTSMSSPNACGGIALVLSGLKQHLSQPGSALDATAGIGGIGITLPTASMSTSGLPTRVRRALEATCLPLGGDAPDAVLTYGRGLMQIDAAFDHLLRTEAVDALAIRYRLSVLPTGGNGAKGMPAPRGIYLRQAHESLRAVSYTVTVTPMLHQDAANVDRLAVEDRLVLEPSHPEWVSCPSSLLLHHSGRSFEVRVDASKLSTGLHYTEVCGYDSSARWRGPLFRVPITVIKPRQVVLQGSSAVEGVSAGQEEGGARLPNLSVGPLAFGPGTEHRQFIEVPEGASWAEVSLTAGSHDTPKVFLLRATQLQPHLSYKRTESSKQATLSSGSEFTWQLPVVPGCTLELTLAQFWSSLGHSSLNGVVEFHGVQADGAGGSGEPGVGLALDGSAGTKRFVVRAPLRNERVKPEAKLTAMQWGLRPTETSLEPLATPRDTLPEGRVLYRLLLSYKLSVAEAGKHMVTLPSINKHVYDGALEAQMTMIYDSHKRLIQVGDVYPEYTQLKKGDYTVRLMLRHDSQELLERLTALTLVVKRRLETPVQLPIFASKRDAIAGGTALTSDFVLRHGECQALFLGPLPDDKLPKDASAGRTLVGKLTLGQVHSGSGAAPVGLPLVYVVPPPKAAGGGDKDKDKAGTASDGGDKAGAGGAEAGSPDEAAAVAGAIAANAAERALATALRDAKIRFLKDMKLGGTAASPEAEQYEALYCQVLVELKAAYPSHLPLLQEHLKKMDSLDATRRGTESGLQSIIDAADEVAAAVDGREVACVLAVKCPEDTPEAKKVRKENEERKSALVDALQRKCKALLELEEKKCPASTTGSSTETVATGATVAAEEDAPAAAEVPAAAGGEAAGTAAAVDAFKLTFSELRKWVDTATDVQYSLLHAKAETRDKRYVSALQVLDKGLADDGVKGSHKEMQVLKQRLLALMSWGHLQSSEEQAMQVKFPKAFQPF